MKNKKKISRSFQNFKTRREKKATESLDRLFSKDMRDNEIKNEINDIKKGKSKFNQIHLKCETKIYFYNFQQYDTIIFFDDNIYTGKINIDETEIDQTI